MTRLKFTAEVIAGQSPPSGDVSELSDGLAFMQGNAEFGAVTPCPKWQVRNPPKKAEKGDVLISVRAPVGALNLADRACGIGRGLAAIRAGGISNGFLWWWLHTQAEHLDAESTGSTFKAISTSKLENLEVPSLSLDGQRAIADYLDRETQRIDDLIAEQRGLIETLRERRQAVIDDSLVGSEEWGIVPLKHLIERVEQGVSPQAESVPARDEEWGVLKSGCVNRGIFREHENKRLPDEFEIDESLAVRVGDVLVSRASGSVKFVGSCARVRNLGHRLILSDKTFRLVPRESVHPDFLVWLLNSRAYREQVRLAVSGAQGLANNLPLSSLRTFAFHVPSTADEQGEVAAYLDEQTSRIDVLIAESEDLIALSLERRAALVTAAVTGQIDVRTAL